MAIPVQVGKKETGTRKGLSAFDRCLIFCHRRQKQNDQNGKGDRQCPGIQQNRNKFPHVHPYQLRCKDTKSL